MTADQSSNSGSDTTHRSGNSGSSGGSSGEGFIGSQGSGSDDNLQDDGLVGQRLVVVERNRRLRLREPGPRRSR